MLRRSLIGIVVATGALWATPGHATYMSDETPRLEIDPFVSAQDIVADSEHYCMTLAVYFEGGSTGESEEGQRHIARVVGERARANRRIWGGATICGVVFHRVNGVCQFSFACLPQARRTPHTGRGWTMSAAIARDELEGRNESPHDLIRYYMNADLTSDRNVCRFRREFVPVIKAGRHEFFREPTARERQELASTEFAACTRYAAALKAAELKAKARGKKHKALAKHHKGKAKLAKASGKKKPARTRLVRR
jgi:cell wall hydrolase